MKLYILSDLHLEFAAFTPLDTNAEVVDVVVLAGDIAVGIEGLHWAAQHFQRPSVIYVPGNHEYDGSEFSFMLARMRHTAHELGIFLLDGDEVVLEDANGQLVRFLGCTLWTDFRLFGEARRTFCMNAASRGLSDYRRIKEAGQRLQPAQTARWHEQHVRWLEEQLQQPFPGKTVVVSHHLPTARSVSERYKTNILSACFASALDHLFGPVSFWVHGHTHDSLDYRVGGTRIVCNPRGYTSDDGSSGLSPENPSFDPGLVVEV